MNRNASVATGTVPITSSRRRRDPAKVRAQFETWLAELSEEEDIDPERGDRIREMIERIGTHVAAANEVGVTPRTVGRWCEGRGIKAEHRAPLAHYLNTTIAYLMYGEQDAPAQHIVLEQLDRIENKLDDLLERLKPSETLEDVADQAARLRDDTQPKPARARRGRKGPGQAA